MNYGLAKQLKDAGFPQKAYKGAVSYVAKQLCIQIDDEIKTVSTDVFVPTLEELIEACGEDFYHLESWNGGDGDWKCAGSNSKQSTVCITFGSTPTEAVARLWLALNKKV